MKGGGAPARSLALQSASSAALALSPGAGVPYMLTGSMAMSAYAPPRMTRDIDLVIECDSSDAQRLIEFLETDCYVDGAGVREAIQPRGSFNIIHRFYGADYDDEARGRIEAALRAA